MLDQDKYMQLMSHIAEKEMGSVEKNKNSLYELPKTLLSEIAGAQDKSCSHTNHGAHVNHSKTSC